MVQAMVSSIVSLSDRQLTMIAAFYRSLESPIRRSRLVDSWLDISYLTGSFHSNRFVLGHTVRLAVELGLHRSIPGLAAKLKEGKTVDVEADQVLVTAARVWLAIYGFGLLVPREYRPLVTDMLS